MTPQPVDFLDFWAKLNLALDDIGLPELGYLNAMVIYRCAVIEGDDLDQLIKKEVAAARAVALNTIAAFLAEGCEP
jgi:hypothetical protein